LEENSSSNLKDDIIYLATRNQKRLLFMDCEMDMNNTLAIQKKNSITIVRHIVFLKKNSSSSPEDDIVGKDTHKH